MRKFAVFIIAFCMALFSCKSDVAPPVKITVVKNKSLIIGNPLDCGIENILIFPVGSNYQPEIFQGNTQLETGRPESTLSFASNTSTFYDKSASTEYINEHVDQFDIRNILFYDQITGKTYSVLKDTMHILSFALHKEFSNPLILYRIVKSDINNDSIYNAEDPVMLYVSDIFGRNMTRITPENEQFVDYFYYEKSQTLLTKTTIDANKDNHFTSKDETNFREMNIKAPAMGREIFSKSLKDSLRLQ